MSPFDISFIVAIPPAATLFR